MAHYLGYDTDIQFLSTPSVRRATASVCLYGSVYVGFLSTPSVRRATHCFAHVACFCVISIHALREEGDGLIVRPHFAGYVNFYPRPP